MPLSDQVPQRPREIGAAALRVSVVDDICGGQTIEHGINVRRVGPLRKPQGQPTGRISKNQIFKTKSGF